MCAKILGKVQNNNEITGALWPLIYGIFGTF